MQFASHADNLQKHQVVINWCYTETTPPQACTTQNKQPHFPSVPVRAGRHVNIRGYLKTWNFKNAEQHLAWAQTLLQEGPAVKALLPELQEAGSFYIFAICALHLFKLLVKVLCCSYGEHRKIETFTSAFVCTKHLNFCTKWELVQLWHPPL